MKSRCNLRYYELKSKIPDWLYRVLGLNAKYVVSYDSVDTNVIVLYKNVHKQNKADFTRLAIQSFDLL